VTDLPTLDHYELKSMDYGRLTGLAIACHAVADAFLLMHVGVGCKNKATAHLLDHDWREHANVREAWTEVAERDLIHGASKRAAPYMRSWYQRMEPAVMVMTSVTFIDLAGEDLADEVLLAADDLPCPVLLVRAPGHEPDMFAGYATLVAAIAEQVDWSRPTKPQQAAVLGFWFDRYEGDCTGNLQQLKGLLKMVGLELGPTFFSGVAYDDLCTAGSAGVVLQLPYALPERARIAAAVQRPIVNVHLPMGIAGTTRWLVEVSEATGADARRVRRLAERRAEYARNQVGIMFARWRSMKVAVVAETPLAAGVCSMLIEFGLHPVLVGLRGQTLGGARELQRVLHDDGLSLPDDTLVIEDPSLYELRERFSSLLAEGALDGVFGSGPDLNVLTTLTPDVMPDASAGGPFVVEMGFPCKQFHAMTPMPWLGYGGVVVMAQRILDARRLWDSGRSPRFHI